MTTPHIERDHSWIQTFTGRQFFPLNPRFEDIQLPDIAHALSNLCRFGGHSDFFYSVAQHSVLVSQHCDPEDALAGLLHDASEAYLIDLPRPIKHAIGLEAYREAERRLQSLIYERFGLKAATPESVERADARLLRTEQRDLLKPAPSSWQDNREGAIDRETIIPLLPAAAKNLFWQRYIELSN